MINELDQGFESHSHSWHSLVESFPQNDRRKSAELLLGQISDFRNLAADSDQDEAYTQWFHQIRECLSGRNCEDSRFRQLTQVIQDYQIPHQYIFDWVKGIRRELQTPIFPDFAELGTCAYLNSSTIALCLGRILESENLSDDMQVALIALGQVDYLLHKISNFIPQLENKQYFLPLYEVQDRGLDLYDQTEPVAAELWQDLVQYQCRRIEELLAVVGRLDELPRGRFRKSVQHLALQHLLLMKKIRRAPDKVLREKISLNRWDVWQTRFQTWSLLRSSG